MSKYLSPLKLLLKISALTMIFVSGVSSSQPYGAGWGACPAGSSVNPLGRGCGNQANAICPSGDWQYMGNGVCQSYATIKAECPAGYEMWLATSESGQCWQWVGPSYPNMGGSDK